MPYTTSVAGTTITASWANTNVRDQVVTPFATAAARTSAVTSPVEGMVSYLSDTKTYWSYNGTAYVPIAPRPIIKQADQAVNNSTTGTTFVNATDLTVAVLANSQYFIDLTIFWSAGTTADFKWGYTVPASSTFRYAPMAVRAASANGDFASFAFDDLSAVPSAGGQGSSQMLVGFLKGTLTTAGTAGSWTFQFAQLVSDAANTTVFAGSSLLALKA